MPNNINLTLGRLSKPILSKWYFLQNLDRVLLNNLLNSLNHLWFCEYERFRTFFRKHFLKFYQDLRVSKIPNYPQHCWGKNLHITSHHIFTSIWQLQGSWRFSQYSWGKVILCSLGYQFKDLKVKLEKNY